MIRGTNDLALIFFFNDTATTEIYTLSLHDALPIYCSSPYTNGNGHKLPAFRQQPCDGFRFEFRSVIHSDGTDAKSNRYRRSEEHTSELQSRQYLVCRLLLEKKKI